MLYPPQERELLFRRLPKFDDAFSGRAPSALTDRIKKAAESQGLSMNEMRVIVMYMGQDIIEWMSRHEDWVQATARKEGVEPEDLVKSLLEMGRSAYEKGAKRG